jgi:hypothetical protein
MSELRSNNIQILLNKALGQEGYVRRNTGDIKYFCPVCGHRKQKLEINLESGAYHCWVCHFKGLSLFSLFRKLSMPESLVRELEAIVGKEPARKTSELDNLFGDHTHETAVEHVELPEGFKPLAHIDRDSMTWRRIFAYAKSRNFDWNHILRYNMGFVESGEYANRLIVPSYNGLGRLNFFSARSIYDNTFLKYLNADVSKNIVGFELFLDYKQPINLVEGALDAITLGRNTTPLFGTSILSELKKNLIENQTPEVRVILDDDALSKAIVISEELTKYNIKVRLVKLNGKDPNKLGFDATIKLIDNTPIFSLTDLIKHRLAL